MITIREGFVKSLISDGAVNGIKKTGGYGIFSNIASRVISRNNAKVNLIHGPLHMAGPSGNGHKKTRSLPQRAKTG